MNVYVRFSLVHNVMIRGFPEDRWLTEKNNADTKERRKERVFFACHAPAQALNYILTAKSTFVLLVELYHLGSLRAYWLHDYVFLNGCEKINYFYLRVEWDSVASFPGYENV